MVNAYSDWSTLEVALAALRLDNYELHNRAECCASLWERIYGEVPPELRHRLEHWLTVRRIRSTDYHDVLVSHRVMQSDARVHTSVYLGDNASVMINLRHLRLVQDSLQPWFWDPSCYAVSAVDLICLNIGYKAQRWPGIAGTILGS